MTQNKIPLCRPDLIISVSGSYGWKLWLLDAMWRLWPHVKPSEGGLGEILFYEGHVLLGDSVKIVGPWLYPKLAVPLCCLQRQKHKASSL